MRRLAMLSLIPALLAQGPQPGAAVHHAPPARRDIEKRIEGVLRNSPAVRQAFVGINVIDAGTGATIYAKDADRFFVPASNTKLFTTALALMRLGPGYRFHTTAEAEHAPDSAGKLTGDLVLVGGGDPDLSGHSVPYGKDPALANGLTGIEDLARQVIDRGVREIDGDVAGDDTAYVWSPYPEGWSIDDAIWEYGAPVNALSLNDNAMSVTIHPADTVGDPAHATLSPPIEHYTLHNRVITSLGREAKIQIDRQPGSREVRIWGNIGAAHAAITELIAIDDPALFAAEALYEALSRRGVSIRGRAVARHRYLSEIVELKGARATAVPPPTEMPVRVELARHTSQPLIEILRVINKVSQNLYAELILREVGRVRRNFGSREAGLEESRRFLIEAGIDANQVHFEDGSGLSRSTLVTPAAVTRLLVYMYGTRYRNQWIRLLPVGGVDGTLRKRFSGQAVAQKIHAKSGSVRNVSALSGYAEMPGVDRSPVAFSVIVNHYNGTPAADIRQFIDKICLALLH